MVYVVWKKREVLNEEIVGAKVLGYEGEKA